MKRDNSQPDLRSLKSLIGKLETRISGYVIPISKNTRRMLNQTYIQSMRLQRVNSLKRALAARESNFDTRQQVRTLKAAKRLPHQRIRNRDYWASVKMPKYLYAGKLVDSGRSGYIGFKGSMQDYVPIYNAYPPVNIMNAQRFGVYGLSNGFECHMGKINLSVPMAKWSTVVLNDVSVTNNSSIPLAFDDAQAQKVLIKAYAKMYEADIQMNEYLFEWRQVFNLLKDPIRTVVRSHKIISKWVRRDSWIMLPARTVRKFGNGLVVSKRPTGALLMSMRTRRTIDPALVSAKTVEEAANRWLQYRYGIMPAAKDVTTVFNLWLNPEGIPFPLKSVSARIWISRSKLITEYPAKFCAMDVRFSVIRHQGANYSAKLWYQVKGQAPSSYLVGLHPSQFANALYNAIPWSFVLDWVVNLDEWMRATMTTDWLQPVMNVVTAKDYTKVQVVARSATTTSVPYFPVKIVKSCYGVKVAERVNRRVNLPRPTSPVVSSAWQSVKNVMTGLALIYKPLYLRK